MSTFGQSAFNFFTNLNPDFKLPDKVSFLLPFRNEIVRRTALDFFNKFYNDTHERIFILGINPGRLGAGTTGIMFTDPIRLSTDCGIDNSLPKKQELSSSFIYETIKTFGGPNVFYNKFFLSSICPVGFVKEGKNLNYYDDKELLQSSRSFILETINTQIKFGANINKAICLGEGKNFKYISELNNQYKFFKKLIPLAHPRYILQYRRKMVDDYYKNYLQVLQEAVD